MIIWGWRGVTSSTGQGVFHCPQCNSRRDYDKKRVQRYFTLYFIPLLPLNELSRYVECRSCRGTYREEVLQYDPQARQQEMQAEFRRAVRRVMVLMMMADGEVADSEKKLMSKVHQQLLGKPLGEAELQSEIAAVSREKTPIADYLARVEPYLNNAGKEIVVKAAFLVAAADGQFQDGERKLLADVARALQMTPAHLTGIINEFAQPN